MFPSLVDGFAPEGGLQGTHSDPKLRLVDCPNRPRPDRDCVDWVWKDVGIPAASNRAHPGLSQDLRSDLLDPCTYQGTDFADI